MNKDWSAVANKSLIVTAQKTQFIIFKVPTRKIPPEFVKLLGIILDQDQHLTFKEHIDNTSKKCHGILGALARASRLMSRFTETRVYCTYVLAWNTPVLFSHWHHKQN